MAYKFQLGDAILSGSLTAKQGSLYSSGSLTDIALRDNAGVRRFDVDYNSGAVRLRLVNSAGAVKASIAETGTISGSKDLNAGGALVVGAQAYGLNANGALTASSMASNWTNAGRTVADMGIVTTMDLNGGTIDGTIIGGASKAAGSFTAVVGTTGTYSAGLTATTGIYSSGVTATSGTYSAGLTATNISGSGTLKAGGSFQVAGTVTLPGVADATLAVATDSFYFLDGDGLMKRDTMADYAAALVNSEPGFASTGGKIQFNPDSLTAASIASGDSMILVDANDSNIPKKETIDDIATLFAGNGLVAASAVLAVQVSGAIHVASDKVSLSGSVAGNGLGFSGGVDSILGLFVSVDDSSIEISADSLRVKAAGITDAMLNDDVATGLAGVGLSAASGVMALDLNELGAAAVNVAADSIAIVDANDSNASKKESIADLVSAMAGAGLTATAGVLSTDAGGTPTGVGNADATLTEGTTYGTTTLTADRTWTLPASPDAGDMVRVKAPPSLDGFKLLLAKQGSHTIDGVNDIILESDSASVTLIYVAANLWKIV